MLVKISCKGFMFIFENCKKLNMSKVIVKEFVNDIRNIENLEVLG